LRHGFCTVSHSLTSPAPLGADRFLVSACPRSTSRSCGCSVPTWPPHFEIRANLATALLRQYCAIVRSHWPEDWSYDAGYRVGEIIVRDEPGLKPNRRISASLKGLWHRQNHGIGKRAPTQRSPPQGGPCGRLARFITCPDCNKPVASVGHRASTRGRCSVESRPAAANLV
jgi:hypothetical protein